jgi:hypothetical protein
MLAVAGGMLVVLPMARAGTIQVDKSTFTAGPSVDFDELANGAPIGSLYAGEGVTFSDFWGDTIDRAFFTDAGTAVAANMSGQQACCVPSATMTFAPFYQMVGFEVFSNGFTTFTVTAADGSTEVFNLNTHIAAPPPVRGRPTPPPSGVFVGFENALGIRSIALGPATGNGAFVIDNIVMQAPLVSGVPEPAGMPLLGLGVLGLLAGVRRRKAARAHHTNT